MAWSYTTGVLTSTGATEASPDSLLAGIAIVQAADATRGYRNGFVAWLAAVEVRVSTGSFIILDDDGQFELRTSSFINPGSGGVIHGNRSTLILNTNTSRVDTTLDFQAGSALIARRERPNDPFPKIVYRNTARHDYPTIVFPNAPAKVNIQGLDLYDASTGAGDTTFLKLYFGLAAIANVSNVRVFSRGRIEAQYQSTTYEDAYIESLSLPTNTEYSVITFNRPTFYLASPAVFGGDIRSGDIYIRNPSFLNNCWNGTVNFNSAAANSVLRIQYGYKNTFREGLTPVQGVNVRFTRARQSINGSPTWTAPDATITAQSNAQGEYSPVWLLDTYRAGTSFTNLERFNWTAKARRYDRRTAGETIFESRVLYRGGVNMAAGYSEEVQMLAVPHLTLTEAQAAALTGITLTPSGATGGTVTVTGARTVSDLWHYYRQKIAQTENFDSNDTWAFDDTTLNTGAWDVAVDTGATLTGNLITTGTVTTTGEFVGSYTDTNGTRVTIRASDNAPVSSFVIIDGVPQGWQSLQTARRIFVQPSSVVQIYAHAYGQQPRLLTVNGNTASDYVISFVPEVHVDTTQTERDTIAADFGIGVDGASRIFLSVDTDLRAYTPQQVLHALHYFVLTQAGAVVGPAAIQAGDLNGFGLINGGFAIRTPGFYAKVADSVTTVSNLGVLIPLYIYVDPAVYTAMPTYTPVEQNTSGIVLQTAPWTQLQADVNTAQISGSVWAYPTRTINGGAATSADVTAAQAAIQADVSAIPTNPLLTTDTRLNNLDAAVSTRATQTSVTALGSPAQATALATLATNNQTEHDATQSAIAALPAPLTSAQTQAAAAAALVAYDGVVPADLAGLALETTAQAILQDTGTTGVVLANGAITSSVVANNALGNNAFTTGYYNQINGEVDAALSDYDAPTKAELDAAQTAITNEVNANEVKIDAVKADTAAIKAKTDAQVNGPTAAQIRTEMEAAGSKLDIAAKKAKAAWVNTL